MRIPFTAVTGNSLLAKLAFGACITLAAPQQAMSEEDDARRIEIQIEHRQVVGDQVIRVTRGERVILIWTTDEAGELHIHGYDIRIAVSPEAPVKLAFSAHATGRFAVTSHGFGGEQNHGHATLLYIEIHPQ